jgi:hypothetical protein
VAIARGAILRGRKTGWLSLEKTARTLIEVCSPSIRTNSEDFNLQARQLRGHPLFRELC